MKPTLKTADAILIADYGKERAMELRPYQQKAVEAVFKSWEEFDKTLLVLPLVRKTVCFAKVAERALKDGGNALVLAHRDELLTQARDKIAAATGLSCAFEKAGESAIDSIFPITCASVQTLMRDSRLRRFSPDHYGTIIVDEAHHALSDSYQNILNYFSSAKVLGVTATPDRGDKQNLGMYFEDIAYEYSIRDAINEGYLSKILVQTIPLKISLKGVKTTAGDYSADDLGSAIDPYLEEIAKHIPRDRKTLIFLPLIATSQRMAQILKSLGYMAEHISGESGERKKILERFHGGECTVLCIQCFLPKVMTKPSVDCVVCLRPTKIRSLYAQIIGRGTRTCEGKDNLLVLDFLWQSEQHSLCHPASLIADKSDVAEQMTKDSRKRSRIRLERP
ncbi:MAG: DEAD/DEAH box helicase [Bacilli bacterium]